MTAKRLLLIVACLMIGTEGFIAVRYSDVDLPKLPQLSLNGFAPSVFGQASDYSSRFSHEAKQATLALGLNIRNDTNAVGNFAGYFARETARVFAGTRKDIGNDLHIWNYATGRNDGNGSTAKSQIALTEIAAIKNQRTWQVSPRGEEAQGIVLGTNTKPETLNSKQISNSNTQSLNRETVNNLIDWRLDEYTKFLAGFLQSSPPGTGGVPCAAGGGGSTTDHTAPSTNAATPPILGGENCTTSSSTTGIVQNQNGNSTAIIGGNPIVTYVPPVQSSGFGGASLAGFTQLSAQGFTAETANISNTLNVSGGTTLSSLTVNNSSTLATSTIANLTVTGSTSLTALSAGTLTLTATSTLATTTISQLILTQPLALTYGGLGFDASSIAKGGIFAGTGSGIMGIQTVGADGLCLLASSTAVSGLAWTNCAVAANAITSLGGLTNPVQSFATGTATGIGLNITSSGSTHTFTPTVTSGYVIPLSASTTEWSAFYNTPSGRITAANNLFWTGNTLGVASGYNIPLTASTTNWNGFYDVPSTRVTAGTNMAWAGNTLNGLSDSAIRGLLSSSATGLTYTSGTGVFSLTSGYNIPLSASTTEWSTFYNLPSTSITSGTGLSWSGNTLNSVWTQSGNNIYNNNSANVGIGTTSPGSTLDVWGNLNVATGSPPTLFVNTATGNVGVGTNNPTGLFQVLGQCVEENTRIRRRRKKKKTPGLAGGGDGSSNTENIGDEYVYEEVPVKDILAGDEVLSLNEQTGEFDWQMVEKTHNKGMQESYKLVTASGKQIETTGEHPYLVLAEQARQTVTTFEVDQSNRIEQLNRDTYLAIANQEFSYTIVVPKKEKLQLYRKYQAKQQKFGWQVFAKAVVAAVKLSNLKVTDLIIDFEYPGYEQAIIAIIKENLPGMGVSFTSVGKSSPAHAAAWGAHRGSQQVQKAITAGQIKKTETPYGAKDLLHHGVVTVDSQAIRSVYLYYQNPAPLSRKQSAKWLKVHELRKGMRIATVDGWEKIAKIYKTGQRKSMYDLQIANTHNFVGNGIVAHNTAIFTVLNSGNVGIGTTSPQTKLDISGGVRTDTGIIINTAGTGNVPTAGMFQIYGTNNKVRLTYPAAADVDFAVNSAGQLAISGGTSVYLNSGNVGIGTTGPGAKLEVYSTGANQIKLTGQATDYGLWTDANGARLGNWSGTSAMVINSTGNVGIGTTSPQGKLEVSGTGESQAVISFDNDNNYSSIANSGLLLMNNGVTQVGHLTYVEGASERLSLGYGTGDNLVINNQGNVGIGTTSPVKTLHVYNGAGNTQIALGDSSGWSGLQQANGIYFNSGEGGGGTDTVFRYGTGLTESMRIKNGNVGIGTTAPGALLDVAGTGNIRTSLMVGINGLASYPLDVRQSTDADKILGNFINPTASTDGRKQTIALGRDNTTNQAVRFDYVYDTTAGDSRLDILHWGDTTGISLKDDGNVGIGTTSPSQLLTVGNNNQFTVSSAGTVTAAGSVIGNAVAVNSYNTLITANYLQLYGAGRVYGDSSGNIWLNDGTDTNVYVKNDGNVGIGTTGPTSLLHVAGTSAVINVDRLSGTVSNYVQFSAAGVLKGAVGIAGTTNALVTGSATNDLALRSESGNILFSTDAGVTANVYIKNDGNVGIGTTGPGYPLEVKNTTSNLANFETTTVNGNSGIKVYSYGGQTGVTLGVNYGSIGYVGTNTNYPMVFNINSVEKVRIDTNGNVGIGTTTPGQKLHVAGDVLIDNGTYSKLKATNDLYLQPSNGFITGYDGSTAFQFGLYNGATQTVQLSSNGNSYISQGNVGIGTTGPNAQLSLGTAYGEGIANKLRLYDDGAAGTSDTSNSSGFGIRGDGRMAYTAGTGGWHSFFTANTERLRIQSGGNVGIGTTSPGSKLSVYGTSGIQILSGNSADYTSLALGRTANEAYIGIAGAANQWSQGSVAGDLNIRTQGSAQRILFNTSAGMGTTDMTINNGNVGIGTTSPTSPLHVQTATGYGLRITGAGILGGSDGNNGVGINLSYNAAGNRQFWIGDTATNFGLRIIGSTLDGFDLTGGTERAMVLQANGSPLSIGTGATGYSLNVYGNVINGSGIFNVASSSGTSYLMVNNNGNVGIGTTGPGAKLEVKVDSSSVVNNSIRLSNSVGQAQGTGLVFLSDPLGVSGGIYTSGRIYSDFSASGYANGRLILQTPTAENTWTDVMTLKSGNVGIGTTGPATKLEVASGSSGEMIRTSLGIQSAGLGLSAASIYGAGIYFNGTLQAVFNNSGGLSLGSYAATTPPPTGGIITSGNVGIGTTGPVGKLQIVGGWLDVDRDSGGIRFTSGVSTRSTIYSDYDNNIFLSPYNTANAVTILNSNGNVGIGTTSPGYKLDVAGDIRIPNVYGYYANLSSGTPVPLASLDNSNVFNFGQGALKISSGGGTATMYIQNNNGNVGIGTTTPSRKLTVFSDGTAGQSQLRVGFSDAYYWDIGRDNGSADGRLMFIGNQNGTPTERMSILANTGNVGIGTTSPAALLNIYANSATNNVAVLENAGTNGVRLDFKSTKVGGRNWAIGSNFITGTAGEFGFYDLTAAAPRMVIDNSGNVGIGTTGPGEKLQVAGSIAATGYYGSINANGLYLYDSGTAGSVSAYASGGGARDLNVQGQNLHLFTGSSYAEKVTILSNGNVGIGTTGPTVPLDVVGAAHTTGNLTVDTRILTPQISGLSGAALQIGGTWSGTGTGPVFYASTLSGASGSVYQVAIKPVWNSGGTTAQTDLLVDRTETSLGSGAQYLIDAGVNTGVHVSKFNVSNTGQVYMNGNVGIGTTTPTAPLTFANTTGRKVYFYDGGGAGTEYGINVASGVLQVYGGSTVALGTYDGTTFSEGMRVTAARVGIYTNNPQNNLDVNGSAAFGTYAGVNTAPANGLIISGNVGIGTTNPTVKLAVSGAGASASITDTTSMAQDVGGYLSLFGNWTGTSPLEFGRIKAGKTNASDGNAASYLAFSTSASAGGVLTERMRILENGNVGIGTTGPGAKLEVANNFTYGVAVNDAIKLSTLLSGGNSTLPTSLGSILWRDESGSTAQARINAVADNLSATANTHLEFWTETGGTVAEKVRIDNQGNVGIGTTNPTLGMLQVAGDIVNAPSSNIRLTGGNELVGSSNLYLGAGSGANIYFRINSSAKVTIDNNGNVGIGTTAPNNKLEISDGAFSFFNNALGPWTAVGMDYDFTSNSLRFRSNNGGANLNQTNMVINRVSGNVGIGTTGPGAKLDVFDGSAHTVLGQGFSGYGAIGFNSTLTSTNYAMQGNGSYTIFNMPTGGSFFFRTNDSNIGSWDSTKLAVTGQLTTTGNVGIGTTGPGYKLDVAGTGHLTGAVTLDSTLVATGSITGNGSGTGAFIIGTNNVSGLSFKSAASTVGMGLGTTDILGFAFGGVYPSAYQFYTAGSTGLAVNGSGAVTVTGNLTVSGTGNTTIAGNVGIGTTSPTQKLSIGSASAGGNVKIANGWLCVDDNDTCTGATTAGNIYMVGAAITSGADVAENYPTVDSSLEPGDVVMADGSFPIYVKKSNLSPTLPSGGEGGSAPVLGVVSTKPGVLLNGYKAQDFGNATTVPVGLAGRVPTKVTNENGNIKIGDFLTSSKQFPGYAMKATEPGQVFGRALENFDSSVPSDSGKILVFIQFTYYQPNVADLVQNALNSGDSELQAWLQTLTNINQTNASAFGDIVVTGSVAIQKDLTVKGIIYAAEINTDLLIGKTIKATEKLCVGETCVTEDQLKAVLKLLENQPASPTGGQGQVTPQSNSGLVAGAVTPSPTPNNPPTDSLTPPTITEPITEPVTTPLNDPLPSPSEPTVSDPAPPAAPAVEPTPSPAE